jgi:hypothetical protein
VFLSWAPSLQPDPPGPPGRTSFVSHVKHLPKSLSRALLSAGLGPRQIGESRSPGFVSLCLGGKGRAKNPEAFGMSGYGTSGQTPGRRGGRNGHGGPREKTSGTEAPREDLWNRGLLRPGLHHFRILAGCKYSPQPGCHVA